MHTFLDISCGMLWSLVYVAAIILAIKRRTWCIPSFSICMNFSWELLVVIKRLLNDAAWTISFWIQFAWCLLDLGIIITWQLFRSRNHRTYLKDLLMFFTALIAVYLLAYLGNSWQLSVFLINLIMSAEFITRLNKDPSNWTSLFIATAKLSGTLAATILNGAVYKNILVLWLGGLCFLADSYYILLLKDRKGKENEIS